MRKLARLLRWLGKQFTKGRRELAKENEQLLFQNMDLVEDMHHMQLRLDALAKEQIVVSARERLQSERLAKLEDLYQEAVDRERWVRECLTDFLAQQKWGVQIFGRGPDIPKFSPDQVEETPIYSTRSQAAQKVRQQVKNFSQRYHEMRKQNAAVKASNRLANMSHDQTEADND